MEENEVVVNYEEVLSQMYGEMQKQTELLEEIHSEVSPLNGAFDVANEYLGKIGLSVDVIMVFAIFVALWDSVRHWRKNVLKVGE